MTDSKQTLPKSYILHSYSFDGAGKGKREKDELIAKSLKANKLAWVHMDATAPEPFLLLSVRMREGINFSNQFILLTLHLTPAMRQRLLNLLIHRLTHG